MKELVLLLGVFALIGCGEKKKSIDTAEGGQDAGPVQEANEEVEVASSGPEPLISAAEVERFVKDAHNGNKSSPPADYTGWVKEISGTELYALSQWKNGKGDGPWMVWYDTGEIMQMGIRKEGEMVLFQEFYLTGEKLLVHSLNDAGLREAVVWHKNGQKAAELIGEDEPESMKFWNEEGKELDREEGEEMMDRIFQK